jgi:hypothetical protein
MKLVIKQTHWKLGDKRGFQIWTISETVTYGTPYNRLLTYRR